MYLQLSGALGALICLVFLSHNFQPFGEIVGCEEVLFWPDGLVFQIRCRGRIEVPVLPALPFPTTPCGAIGCDGQLSGLTSLTVLPAQFTISLRDLVWIVLRLKPFL